ncbi:MULTISPECIES: DNA methyltransferase [Planktothrix]|jgi:DNA methylase|uniref:DNA methylase N-4/N-6 domain-containing protein n=2 Tax=Planktothrix TaxID=54304 RepID=A0A4P5ZDU2_PLAAG|nr:MULTISPECIES: DNA methyltransferase [Planktothrix]CAD5941269.1 hypothetical protein NO108_02313 [Planktothrix rubescens]CAC5342179.1 Type II modification methylase [Planktothrix rubescens NIVA-CYA 18]CAD5925338.1 hypothetical protein PCC7821_00929 [Planktothrix rubescens NIVA-CYA 18]CAH2571480.1 hypothetical protein PRNO82_00878 [Planktothrix rubescens]GDZ94220.1 hypothetical protein PA905_21730 [Planktothrix agardhii CCAP 1459/11A]
MENYYQLNLFNHSQNSINYNNLKYPKGYKGLARFHKYWGKKPIESLSFLIDALTQKDDLILDPFLGSGLVAREALLKKRRFIGIDINPIAIELSNLMVNLPCSFQLQEAINNLDQKIKHKIYKTYILEDDKIASHYLWNGEELISTWNISNFKKTREERQPTDYDCILINQYENYISKSLRKIQLFNNSRINTTNLLTLNDIFTGRALYNIDILREEINHLPQNIQKPLLLSLTAASGQMSKMVFAITSRGKNQNKITNKIEVGSWVVGYWRPKLHFEINVWNCFENKVNNLIKSVIDNKEKERYLVSTRLEPVINKNNQLALILGNNLTVLKECPDEVVSLIITDPPHGDRIPYLELSEMWNSLLGKIPNFTEEIVISNAKNREKNKEDYTHNMSIFLKTASRILKPSGILALFFNAKDKDSWKFLKQHLTSLQYLKFRGYFPMNYSAQSVIQDNREGSLKSDFILIYQKSGIDDLEKLKPLLEIPEWSVEFPEDFLKLN